MGMSPRRGGRREAGRHGCVAVPLRDGGNLSAGSWPMRAAAHAAADRRRPGGDGGFGGTSQAIAGPGRAFPRGEAPPAAGRARAAARPERFQRRPASEPAVRRHRSASRLRSFCRCPDRRTGHPIVAAQVGHDVRTGPAPVLAAEGRVGTGVPTEPVRIVACPVAGSPKGRRAAEGVAGAGEEGARPGRAMAAGARARQPWRVRTP